MTRDLIAIFVSIMVVSTSCRKNTTTTPIQDPSPFIGKLAKVAYENGMYDSIYYNGDGLIQKIKFHTELPGPPYDNIYVFEYDNFKRIARIMYNQVANYDYRYVNGQLAEVDHYVSGEKMDYNIYSYQNGITNKIEEYYKSNTNTTGYELMGQSDLFYYPDGNLHQEISYYFNSQTHLPVIGYSVEYVDYDNKFNPIDPVINNLPYQSQTQRTKNNPGKITISNGVNMNVGITEYNFEYTYDVFSKPLTRKTSYLFGGQLQTETMHYYYY